MMIRHICLGFFALLMSASVLANEVALNPDHPDRYVVVKGDTLDIFIAPRLETL